MPAPSELAGMVIVAVPPEESVPEAVKLEPLPLAASETEPVGVGPVPALAMVMVTLSVSLELIVPEAGVTVTFAADVPAVAGQAFTRLATLTEPSPVARSYPTPALYPV